MTAWAAPISLVGSSAARAFLNRTRCLGGVVVASQQQQSVGPDWVGGDAAAAVQLPADPLPDLGDHQVRHRDQVPVVDRDPDCGSAARIPAAETSSHDPTLRSEHPVWP